VPGCWAQWFIPIIPATLEAVEIQKIMVQGQIKPLSEKQLKQKGLNVAEVVEHLPNKPQYQKKTNPKKKAKNSSTSPSPVESSSCMLSSAVTTLPLRGLLLKRQARPHSHPRPYHLPSFSLNSIRTILQIATVSPWLGGAPSSI
jgi:hypothetical protein